MAAKPYPWMRAVPTGAGELDTDDDDFLSVEQWPADAFGPHFHEEFNWLIPMMPGRLVMRVGERELTVDRDHWICVLPRVPHAVVHVSDDCEVLSLFVPQEVMFAAFQDLEVPPELGDFFVGGKIAIAQGLALAWGEQRFSERPPGPLEASFAHALAGWLWRTSEPTLAEHPVALELRLRLGELGVALARYYDDHLAETPFPFDGLAEHAGLSQRTLQRQLAEKLGRSPAAVLAQFRLERARDLLRDPARPLGDVALACGYSSQAHFSTVFKAATGLAPGRWRKQHLER